ncbi:UDP-N-acetylmuramoylalanyl-D-glutamyl-2,6-diaminopimelate--D-alanyl-D-alanine ligase [Chelativorans sp. M5D2P16]|uniref:UDP-N-acetylmuramoylalanyl-D-glutamyl-2, 6-diaminopimelate--D-alanyl-D-alanine ligase n=1 Tax=Chelativorans sp. M5D2P16 TaxID=3095678 RepID=UPI002ACAF4D6|nr:UDP-N-acetylmuramoylalanyl-D-glutamyl-2,6-diaminopimelate--D-alanyl-D-alanine ligase [Chelativorans sp. M5D2P16]MDZ5698159.1 UDP-N-acetylmuramoylalanyl-D-glutamyl-2,6-diaminopimelate--D-alanyl-D-alanine ligase [Chelativorans sp. M5D2P16]
MTFLWDTQALLAATGGRPLGNVPEGVTGISIDTRTLERGEAFFAIKGERFDGHDFATGAMAAGAELLVVSEEKLPALGRLSVPKIVVPDVLKALEGLAAAARARTKAKVIAVTGSAGKTTTKEMLRHALSGFGKVHAADRSFNNHWGVPLTLARMPDDCDYAVFEIGMNHAGEIAPLTRLVKPQTAIVTMIAAAHLGHFKSLDAIAEAKGEILSGVAAGGHALLNRDDQRFKILSKMAGEAGIKNVWSFGENTRAQFRLIDWQQEEEGSAVTVKIAGQEMTGRIGVPGRHMVQNALAALGAGYLAGADAEKMLAALADFTAEEGRGKRHRLKAGAGAFTLIDESYNANPASMRAAMQLLAATPVGEEGRRIAVLGDMLELGEHSAKLHAALGDLIAASSVDLLLLGGPEMKRLADNVPSGPQVEYRESAEELRPLLLKTVRPGDAIVIKSSKGIGFSGLVDALIKNFPAAEEPART